MTDQTFQPIPADPNREYVAGGFLPWYTAYQTGLASLPLPIDALTADLGDDTYERMMTDPQVNAVLGVLKTAILEDGPTLRPAIDDADQDGYEQSKMLVDLCERQIDNLEVSLNDVLYDMLSAIAIGYRVAEEVYDLDSTYTGRTEIVLRRLNVKPRQNVAFVTDVYGNVVGILPAQPGQPLTHGAILSDSDRARILPRSKFAILSFRPKDNDPRGQSVLRTAYNPWWSKQTLWPEYLRYLAQFASPSLDGECAPVPPGGDGLVPIYDSNGYPTGTYQTAEEAYLQRLLLFRNGTAIARPSGSKLNVLWAQGDGKAFLNAFELFDKQIAKAILYQTLATEEASYGTRSQGSIHETILGTQIRQIKQSVARMLYRDVLQQIVIANGTPQDRTLTPYPSLGEAETQDLPSLWNAVAALRRANYLDPSQYPDLDAMLNLPPRAMREDQSDPETATPDEDTADESDSSPARL